MRTIREQIENRCVHFNGIQNKTCRAGVEYGRGRPPCFKDETTPSYSCDKKEFPTEEQIKKELDDHSESNRKMALVFNAIGEVKREHKGENWSGTIKCPACGGELWMSHAAYNGHVWGRCKTEGCVAWME